MNDIKRPVIAVDAMGGDHGPRVIVPGAVDALTTDSGYDLAFYGDEEAVRAELDKLDTDGLSVFIVHCSQTIEMDEAPATAIRSKQDSPIVRAMADQKAGKIHAVVSAGSTGAMVAASLIILGRLPGVDRPAIGTLIPTVTGELLLLDVGANVQSKPEHLVSFGRMGEVFAREILNVVEPTVGQLNIGGEAKKGSELSVAAYSALSESSVNFIGNVEGNQIMLGPCNVIVTDGFTGNNTLKLIEGFARFIGALSQKPGIDAAEKEALQSVLKIMMRDFTYEIYGGAMLLGVSGISIIAHGRSSSVAFTNAVKVAWKQVEIDLPRKLAEAHSS